MKKFIASLVSIVVFALLLSIPADVQAQDRDQQIWRDSAPTQPLNNPGPPQLPNAPQQTPIGSGLGILLIAGGAYAVRRLRQQKED